MMGAMPGGVILTPGHKAWCERQKRGDGTNDGPCDCGAGRPHPPGTAHPWVHCRKCGVVEELHYFGAQEIAARGLCFNCDFWWKRSQERDAGVVVVAGCRYAFDPAHPMKLSNTQWNGFAGHRWEIQFFSGRRVVTNNLWTQGDIPPLWRPAIPDNATFLHRFRALVLA